MKGKGLMLILSLTIGLLLASIGFLFLVMNGTIDNPFVEKIYADVNDINLDELSSHTFELDEIVTNIGKNEFARVSITFVTNKKSTREELELRADFIQSDILKVINQVTREEVKSKDGLSKLEDKLLAIVNDNIQDGEVIGAYITDFIIQ